MRFGYGLIAGSLVLAGPGAASEPAASAPPIPEQLEPMKAPDGQPKPKRSGINTEIVVQPVEPAVQPQSPKSGVDTGTVVQGGEPAAETRQPEYIYCPGGWGAVCRIGNARYETEMQLIPGSEPCPGFKYYPPSPEVIEPASKGRGFYLPLHQFTNAFPGPIILENPTTLTELGHPMSFQGLIAVRDVTSELVDGLNKIEARSVQGWGVFSGYLAADASRFSVDYEVNWVSQGKKCSMTGSLTGKRTYRF